MKSSYISYYVGYDAAGQAIYEGNGSIIVGHHPDESVDPEVIADEIAYLLEKVQESNSLVTRIVIKNLMKL